MSRTAADSFLERLEILEDTSSLSLDQGKWCAAQICILERHINRLDERIDSLEEQLAAVNTNGLRWVRVLSSKLSTLRRLLVCRGRRGVCVQV